MHIGRGLGVGNEAFLRRDRCMTYIYLSIYLSIYNIKRARESERQRARTRGGAHEHEREKERERARTRASDASV
jgi:hypothetical protein